MIGKVIFIVLLIIGVALAAANWKRLEAAGRKTRQFGSEVMVEMHRVSWPAKDHVVNSTIMVGVFTIATMVLMWFFDLISGEMVKSIFIGQ
jgi:preprotein translocase SecE subunit